MQNTKYKLESDSECNIDYCRYTVRGENPLAIAQATLAAFNPEWVPLPHGLWGYRMGVQWGVVKILYDNASSDNCATVELSGEGCRQLEHTGLTDWGVFFRRVFDIGGRFTRIDWAIDSYQTKWGQVVESYRKGDFRASARMRSLIENSFSGELSHAPGGTLNLGMPGSGTRVCIYHKGAEQSDDFAGDSWVRFELRLADAAASSSAESYIQARERSVYEHFCAVVDFRSEGDRRKPRLEWFQRVVGFFRGARPYPAEHRVVPTSVKGMASWVEFSVSRVLAIVVSSPAYGIPWLNRVLLQGYERLSETDRELIRAGKLLDGSRPADMEELPLMANLLDVPVEEQYRQVVRVCPAVKAKNRAALRRAAAPPPLVASGFAVAGTRLMLGKD